MTDHDLKATQIKQQSNDITREVKSHAIRLRQIEQLYQEGLLTTQEYEAKRNDVLDEDWGK